MRLKKNVNQTSINSHASHRHNSFQDSTSYDILEVEFFYGGNTMIPNPILKRAELSPHQIGFRYDNEDFTFLQITEQAKKIASQMHQLKLSKGSRIAFYYTSNDDLYFLLCASLLAEIEIVMLNTRLTKEELQYQIQEANVDAVITDQLAKIASLHPHVYNMDSIVKQPFEHMSWNRTIDKEQTATIMFTSGTTGFPKGVRQTHGNHLSNALAAVSNTGHLSSDVWLCTMPLFHISGFSIIMRSFYFGFTMELHQKFNAEKSAEAITKGTITIQSVVAKTLSDILQVMEEKQQLAHADFRYVLAGGGAIPEAYIERAKRLNLPVIQTYGMTETSSQTATLAFQDAQRKIGSVGKPLYFHEISIEGRQIANQIGEIWIKGPHVTPGYIGRFEKTPAQIDGWLHTGDLGYYDDEGYLYIVDRRNDLIISGGENIYPAEIEKVLLAHPSVLEAGVCGRADGEWGEVPLAYVIAKEGVSEEELIHFCEQRLARYKLPKQIIFVQELPRNSSNKMLRRVLKEWANEN